MEAETLKIPGNKGFTLVELLVTLAVASIVILVLVQFFYSTNKVNTVQDAIAGTQQSIRVAMEIMGRDIRMAGLDPSQTASGSGFLDKGDDMDDTDADPVSVSYDYDGDGTCEIDRSYYYDVDNERLMMRDETSYSALTGEGTISSVSFSYTLDDGSSDTDPSGNGNLDNIRMVTIKICGKVTGPYEDEFTHTYCFSNTITPRNM